MSAQLSEQLRELIPKIAVGLPMEEPQPFMGTLINERAAEQMLNAQAVLLERGAEPVVPMQRRESCNALVTLVCWN
ncbi:N-succinylglutamate 5-semialdehyde dehydrogenase [Aureliella helgolandensis]|uniref:N-succinylglutamate 5-semialdehyde dehydrogenase n=1 Tax=Aureliella helgolandensis TaxID=2527968 RepID=A0A518GHM4_9BACT|nr:N-succinylglutamate 5-semialdehyde dehydrogenase [Aureliella helgolandensis]